MWYTISWVVKDTATSLAKTTVSVYSPALLRISRGVGMGYFNFNDEVGGSRPPRRNPVAQLVRARQ